MQSWRVHLQTLSPSLYLMFLGHSQRKMAICSCCHIMMYPGSSENHKRGYCANGPRQVKTKGEDDIPDWPQPQAQWIYVKGTDFHPVGFLKTPWDMHEKVVVGGERSADLSVEYEVLGKKLQRRRTIDDDSDGNVLFTCMT